MRVQQLVVSEARGCATHVFASFLRPSCALFPKPFLAFNIGIFPNNFNQRLKFP